MLFLKQKADGTLCPQQSPSIYNRRLADGRGWLKVSGCGDTKVSVHWITALPQIWSPGHKGPVKGSLGRQVAPPHPVPQRETKELEQNITKVLARFSTELSQQTSLSLSLSCSLLIFIFRWFS